MDVNESVREAERILHAAGWQEAPGWQGYTHGPCVGGVAPDGTLYVKSIQMVKEGDPRYGPDTPDEHHEAAAWLVEHAKARAPQDDSPAAADTMMLAQEEEPAETPQHESDGETGEKAATEEAGPLPETGAGLGDEDHAGGSAEALADVTAGLVEAWRPATTEDSGGIAESEGLIDPIDADFEAIEELGAQDELAETDFETLAIEGADAEPEAPAQGEAPQDRFYGLDDLDRRRSLRIGDVVRVSRARQEAIWEQSGTTEAAYEHLVSQVMRDTRDGMYVGPPEPFDQFTALQVWANKAAAVRREEGDRVAFLTNPETTREQIEAFDPEANWP